MTDKLHNRSSPHLLFEKDEMVQETSATLEKPIKTGLKGENKKPKSSRLRHSVEKVLRSAEDQFHRQVARANESDDASEQDENVAVTAALRADEVVSTTVQKGEAIYRAHQDRRQNKAALPDEKPINPHGEASGEAFEQPAGQRAKTGKEREQPQFTSNPISRLQQRRTIKKEYAAAKRSRGRLTFSEVTHSAQRAVDDARDAAGKTVQTARRHPAALLVLLLAGMLMIIMSMLQSCTPLVQSVLESIIIGTYPATEEDVRAAERAYLAKERELKDEMDHYKRYHPGYDEYHIDADEIWHDPYVLIAIISAYYDGQEWNIDSAMPVIEKYFALQYEVTENVVTETRYRKERQSGTRMVEGSDGRTKVETYYYDAQVPYTYTICNVRLENKNLSHLPVVSMSHHTMGMYALYMATHGNMEGIFSGPHATPLRDPVLYDIPQETLDTDPTFAKLMEEATKYIGYPYVWGGADPETSFDCSGFISYVYTHSGVYNTGRLGAKGLHSLCQTVPPDQAKPGDIVFFEGTMGEGVDGITHCGIYVGNHRMLHCGSPIGYADLNDSYWRKHFHSYGRMPN